MNPKSAKIEALKAMKNDKPAPPPPQHVLVVLSGGQDSTTCLFHAIHSGVTEVGAISFDYNQRHKRELDSAAFVYELARTEAYYNPGIHIDMPKYRIVKCLGDIFDGLSPLTNKNEKLETYNNITEMDAKLTNRIELTFVPGRNAAFITLAFSTAVVCGYDAIVLGVNGADNANYPDCTPEFISTMESAMQLATRSKVKILTPLQGLSKKEIVEMGIRLPGCMRALAFTTTDYAGSYPPGKNHASVLRAWGFKEAEVKDPLIERAEMEGLL